ncbi:MAG: hypothetical protein MZU91_02930 [Desulfosudis oleivorans]|nr:hypothetical protein [Desulfosudis oleivorans]
MSRLFLLPDDLHLVGRAQAKGCMDRLGLLLSGLRRAGYCSRITGSHGCGLENQIGAYKNYIDEH